MIKTTVSPTHARNQRRSLAGFTALEVMFSTTLMIFIVGGVTSSFWTIERGFDEQLTESDLQLKSRTAMDRLVRLTSSALTTDTSFDMMDSTTRSGTKTEFDTSYNLVETTTTVDSTASLCFRELESVTNGVAVYDDTKKFYLLGPDALTPTEGIVLGRGPDANTVSTFAAGPDGILGTKDDDTKVEFVLGTPAVETILSGDYKPQGGSMLEFTTEAGGDGRMVTITLRANVLRSDGTYLRTNDLVLEERVALRW